MTTSSGVRVQDARQRTRFEALDDDGNLMGFAEYRLQGNLIRFIHAETLPEFRGRGVAGTIAAESLRAARDSGLRVRPDCPFYQTYFEEHPEYADLLEVRTGG